MTQKMKLIIEKIAPIGVAAPEKVLVHWLQFFVLITKRGILKDLVSQSQKLLCTKLVYKSKLSQKMIMRTERSSEHFLKCTTGHNALSKSGIWLVSTSG